MLHVKKEGVVLSKRAFDFENHGVLNPAVILHVGLIHMFYRAVTAGNRSTIGYCNFKEPLVVNDRLDEPLLVPEFEYESQGMEDPRIVKIDDVFYLSYCGYDGINAYGLVATSFDLKTFTRLGVMVPVIQTARFDEFLEAFPLIKKRYLPFHQPEQMNETPAHKIFMWDKNVIFFPRRIDGNLVFLHRIKPDIQIVSVKNLADINEQFWVDYFTAFDEKILLTPEYDFAETYIGGGCPPIETQEGWLLIYHGVQTTNKGNIYSACAALLDIDNPQKIIAKLPYALFKPELEWELNGEVSNVCFPTGAIVLDDSIFIYYGGADEKIGCASVSLQALLTELLQNRVKNETENYEQSFSVINS